MRKMVIYDLDNTIICSKHRQVWNDGILDLEHWLENCKPELIALDSELPLVKNWREFWNAGAVIAVCTSRVMADADFAWLESRNLRYHYMVSRTRGDNRDDIAFKREGLERLITLSGFEPHAIMYWDDRLDLVEMGRNMGLDAFHVANTR